MTRTCSLLDLYTFIQIELRKNTSTCIFLGCLDPSKQYIGMKLPVTPLKENDLGNFQFIDDSNFKNCVHIHYTDTISCL